MEACLSFPEQHYNFYNFMLKTWAHTSLSIKQLQFLNNFAHHGKRLWKQLCSYDQRQEQTALLMLVKYYVLLGYEYMTLCL